MAKYIDVELIKSTQSLYSDIDSCIDELLKARTEHNQENEGRALFRMEGLMVGTLQQLSCIIDSLQQEQSEVNLEKAAEYYYHKGVYEGLSQGRADALKMLEEFMKRKANPVIVIKQQEQPEPSCKTCGFYENNCPFIRGKLIPYPNKVCKDYTYSVMKEQEQPDMNLEKEMTAYFKDWYILETDQGYILKTQNGSAVVGDVKNVARHFYELGRNTKMK